MTSTQSDTIIKAISNELRRNIVRLLIDQSRSYTDIAHFLKFDLKSESGKFNFHLQELVKADLVDKTDDNLYRLTERGEEIYYLLLDIERDREIDPHGLVSLLVKMSPLDEFKLFSATMGIIVGLMALFLGISSIFIGNDTQVSGIIIYGIILGLLGIVLEYFSLPYYYRKITSTMGSKQARSRLLSTIFFLDTQWYFVRSKNRVHYFLISLFLMAGAVYTIAIPLILLSAAAGTENLEVNDVLPFLGIAVVVLLFGLYFYNRLRIKLLQSPRN